MSEVGAVLIGAIIIVWVGVGVEAMIVVGWGVAVEQYKWQQY